MGGGPRVVVSTAAFHARVRGSVPGLGGLKETKLFLPHPRVKVSIVGSLRDREVSCSASDRQGSNFESCVWRTVSSQSSHHPQEVLLAQFSLYVHKGGLKPDSFHLHALIIVFTGSFSRISLHALKHALNIFCTIFPKLGNFNTTNSVIDLTENLNGIVEQRKFLCLFTSWVCFLFCNASLTQFPNCITRRGDRRIHFDCVFWVYNTSVITP